MTTNEASLPMGGFVSHEFRGSNKTDGGRSASAHEEPLYTCYLTHGASARTSNEKFEARATEPACFTFPDVFLTCQDRPAVATTHVSSPATVTLHELFLVGAGGQV